jgi:Leucine Rich repeat
MAALRVFGVVLALLAVVSCGFAEDDTEAVVTEMPPLELVELVRRDNGPVVDPPQFDSTTDNPAEKTVISLELLAEILGGLRASSSAAKSLPRLVLAARSAGTVSAQVLTAAVEAGMFRGIPELELQSQRIADNGTTLFLEAILHAKGVSIVGSDEEKTSDDGSLALEAGDLRALYFGNANLLGSHKAITSLCALISSNNLDILSLRYNKLGSRSSLPFGAIADALRESQSLRELALDYNPVGNDGITLLGDGLSGQSSLRNLSLQFCKIGAEGIRKLSPNLKDNLGLRQLNLVGNQVGRKGVKLLAAALADHPSIRTLQLWGKDINDASMEHFATLLGGSAELGELMLWNSGLTDAGAVQLAGLLQAKPQAGLSVMIRNSAIGANGRAALQQAVKDGILGAVEIDSDAPTGSSSANLSPEGRERIERLVQDFQQKMSG